MSLATTCSSRAAHVIVLAAAVYLVAACGGGGGAAAGASTTGSGGSTTQPPAQEFYAAPVKVTETLRFTAIAAGYHHTCAVATGGDTYCWGYNEFDQLGSSEAMARCVSGMFACSATPVRVDGALRFASLTASIRHTCALDAGGTAYCWGFGLGGQLGDGQRTNSVAPVAVAGGLRFAQLSASAAGGATCGLTAAGDAWCWGINAGGELGNGTMTELAAAPNPVTTSAKFRSISVGDQHTCAVDTAFNAQCWGNNWFGQLGVGSAGGSGGLAASYAPVAVLGGLKFEQIVAAGMHSCALQASGAAYCWGLSRQLGVPLPSSYVSLPEPVVAANPGWVELGRGYGQTCALNQLGELYCWGHRTALPDVTAETPIRIGGSQTFAAFSPGGTHACAIGTDGFAYCWGSNSWGQVARPPSDP